jgi:hypothetical protein
MGAGPAGALLRVSGFVDLNVLAVQLVDESDELVGLCVTETYMSDKRQVVASRRAAQT